MSNLPALRSIVTKEEKDSVFQKGTLRIYLGAQFVGRAIPHTEFVMSGQTYVFQSLLDIVQSETNGHDLIWIYNHVIKSFERLLNNIIRYENSSISTY